MNQEYQAELTALDIYHETRCRAIAAELGPEWGYQRRCAAGHYASGENGLIAGPEGLAFYLVPERYSFDREEGRPEWQRIRVSGRWPEGVYPAQLLPAETSPSIALSAHKTPQQLAREIQRRFLPAYTALYTRCAELAVERADYAARIHALRGLLLATGAVRANPTNQTLSLHSSERNRGHGEVQITSPGSVDLHMRALCPALALKLLEVFKNG